eukprot:CAMPEP_0174277598 /NCGR_PEP_ID=MMETSP0439-20130205/61021_1 /TAXON_ID=0 /ORGANISM="Stereomyxa ramosa, Strain Chinc5" /LENGTH=345 /DNA_ID=CAMNT_0015369935 /DNA_START=24 /DNA_END=1059 /DNA_ORIENTATION=-
MEEGKEYKIHYLRHPGRAGCIRAALKLSGVAFENSYFALEDWPLQKHNSLWKTCPWVDVKGKGTLAQSNATLRYIGKLTNLYPSDNWLAAKVDEVLDACEDLYKKVAETYVMEEGEQKAARGVLSGKGGGIHVYLSGFESIANEMGTDKGFIVGDSLRDDKLRTSVSFFFITSTTTMEQSKFNIHYWPFPGRAGCLRAALKVSKVPFEDTTFAREEWAQQKDTPLWKTCPWVDVEGKGTIGQSNAALRYIGKETGLYPTDNWTAAKVDEVLDACEDVYGKIGPTFRLQGEEQKAAREALVAEGGAFHVYLSGFESIANEMGTDKGFIVGDSLTIADLKLYYILQW